MLNESEVGQPKAKGSFLLRLVFGIILLGLAFGGAIFGVTQKTINTELTQSLRQTRTALERYETAFAATFGTRSPASLQVRDPRFRSGLVAEVYPPEKDVREQLGYRNVGRFVVDEAVFDLMTHSRHLIQQPRSGNYVLNGFYAAAQGGEHQFGIEVRYAFEDELVREFQLDAMCRVSGGVQGKVLFDRTVTLSTGGLKDFLVTGSIALPPGLHTVRFFIGCSETSYVNGEDLVIRLQTRTPSDATLTFDRDRFLHIQG